MTFGATTRTSFRRWGMGRIRHMILKLRWSKVLIIPTLRKDDANSQNIANFAIWQKRNMIWRFARIKPPFFRSAAFVSILNYVWVLWEFCRHVAGNNCHAGGGLNNCFCRNMVPSLVIKQTINELYLLYWGCVKRSNLVIWRVERCTI